MSRQTRFGNKTPKQDVLTEARMVLPGIQALFGFQLVAVFNQRFDRLGECDKACHIAALLLVALATGLVMAPAAIDRFATGRRGEQYLRRWAPSLLAAGMFMLMMAIALELFVVSKLVLGPAVAWIVSAVGGAVLWALWFALPLFLRWRK